VIVPVPLAPVIALNRRYERLSRRPRIRVEQWQRLAEFVTGAPEHLAAGIRRIGQRRSHERGLADSRLALNQHRTPTPRGHLCHQADQHRGLAVAAD